ncbi:rod shape-determining protein MreD [Saonia flava]|uniref:Rod shape-determining protein MreD n=1 Tax=Saonia flava TaxID=523696 RepID=A0A846QSE6_9FLAO|nr:rod shape-determining protein MreD [Saonia flava]NJB71906.1 rod shape-determining protein MreD [Saonia flava]
MFSNFYFINILRFVLLVLVQVLVFNKLNFLGYINPFVYILFLYWYPIKENKGAFIVIAFLLGLFVDIFSDTLALHTAATVTIAFLRPSLMRFVFGVNYEFQSFRISSATKAQQITFLALLIIIHHIVFFSLEILSFSNALLILKKIIVTFCGTFLMCILLSLLFKVEK